MRRLFFLVIALLFAASSAYADDAQGELVGRVTNAETMEPLVGVNVYLIYPRLGATTNEQGRFVIGHMPPGVYRLKSSLIGYVAQEKQVVVEAGQTTTSDFSLLPQTLLQNEVVVTATRTERFKRDVPVVVQVVDDFIFKATHAINLSESLFFQPGLRVENSCQNCNFTQVRLNGMDGNYAQILIDGRPVFSALNTVYGLDHLPVAMIDRVEVVRGGGSALYGGNAIAGTINVVTREPIRSGFEVSTTQAFINGDTPDRNIHLSSSMISEGQHIGISLFGVFRKRDPYDHDGDGFSELGLIKNNSFGMRGFYRVAPLSKLMLELHSLYEDRRGGNRFEFQPHEADVAETAKHHVLGGSMSFETFFSRVREQRFSTYVSLQKTERDSYYGAGRDPNAYGFTKGVTAIAGAQYGIALDHGVRNEIMIGIEAQRDHLDDHAPAYNVFTDQTIRQLGAFAQSDWKVTDRFSVLLGLRLDAHSELDKPVLNPRANAMFSLTEKSQIRLSAAMGFRAPQIFDEDLHITQVGGEASLIYLSPDLGPERSYSVTASLDHSDNAAALPWGITLEGFYTRLVDPFILEQGIPDVAGTLVFWRQNGDGASVFGGTLEARAFLNRQFQSQIGLTVQSSRYDTPVEWAEGQFFNRMVRSPRIYGYYAASYAFNQHLNLSLSGIYTGPMHVPHFAGYIEEDRLERTGSFFEANLKVEIDLTAGSEMAQTQFFAGIQNLFNQYQSDFDQGPDRDAGYTYGPNRPRTFYTGLKVAY